MYTNVFVFETLILIHVVLMHMGTGVILWDLDSFPFVTFLKESDFYSFSSLPPPAAPRLGVRSGKLPQPLVGFISCLGLGPQETT